MEFHSILKVIDIIFFLLFSLMTAYLLIYSIASLKKCYRNFPKSENRLKFLVLFPAYKEDLIIFSSIQNFLGQDYHIENFDIFVISDKMSKETNAELMTLPIRVLEVNFENSTKAKALNFAIDNIGEKEYDIVVIMDADNTADNNFLSNICDAFNSGLKAIQTHRVAKNLNTETAILDAISEEINNSIFRKGHVNLGVSSALIGSGMAFDFKWFKENIRKISSLPEERELEVLLLRQRVFIDYLQDVRVYDEKTQKDSVFYNQRRRWLASQLETLKSVLKELPGAIVSFNISYSDKIIQWLFLPRVLLLGILIITALLISIFSIEYSLKWWFLIFILSISLFIAIPRYLVNKRSFKALKKAPILFLLMAFNIFKLKNTNKNFIHTEKNFK